MVGFRALVVHTSEEVSAQLARALEAVGVSTEILSDPEEAAARLRREQYGAVLLHDELPGAGSLHIYEALEGLEQPRPPVVMIFVPRDMLAELRQASSDYVEYVADPEEEPDVERLALRVRSRLVSAGLAEEFGALPVRWNEAVPPAAGRKLLSQGHPNRRQYLAVLAVLVILLGLWFLLQHLPSVAAGLTEPPYELAVAMLSAQTATSLSRCPI